MSELLSEHQHKHLGILQQVVDEQTRIADAVAALAGGARRWARLRWAAGLFDKYEDGQACQGFLIYNDGPTDAFVGLSSADLTAAAALLTVPAGTWIALPLISSRIIVGAGGSGAAGTLLVFGLDHAPDPAAGSVTAAIIDGVYNLTQPAVVSGQRAPLQLDANGNLRVVPGVAARPADLSDAVALASGFATGGFLFNGATWDRARTPNVFKPIVGVAIGTEVALWTPAAGKKFRLMGFFLNVSTTADTIVFRDGVGGTIIAASLAQTVNAQPAPVLLGNGILSALANNALTARTASGANFASGMVFGTEE